MIAVIFVILIKIYVLPPCSEFYWEKIQGVVSTNKIRTNILIQHKWQISTKEFTIAR